MSTVPPSVAPPTRTRSSTQTPSAGPFALPPLNLSSQAVAPAPPAAAAKPAAAAPEMLSSGFAVENGEHCHLPSPLPQQPPHPDPAVEQLIQTFFPRRPNPAHPWAAHGETIRYLLLYYEFIDIAVLGRAHESQRSSAKLLKYAFVP